MTELSHVRSVFVNRQHVQQAYSHLQKAGRNGMEGIALWAGTLTRDQFDVQSTIIPAQSGLRFEDGMCVQVAGEELHRINVWLYEHWMTLIAQLHSHPAEAYHSWTDDTLPIVTTLGGLSIVIPGFARQPFSLADCAVYRLLAEGWCELSSSEIKRLITITE